MAKKYDTRQDFDEDYSFGFDQQRRVLPETYGKFQGNRLTVDPMWADVKQGGCLQLSMGRKLVNGKVVIDPNNVTLTKIVNIVGNTLFLEHTFAENTEQIIPFNCAQYIEPKIMLPYRATVVRGGSWTMAARITRALNLTGSEKLLIVGCGFGYELEWWLDNGFDAVGTEISQYILDNKDNPDETEDLKDDLRKAGFDPDSPAGQNYLSRMSKNRCRFPDKILNANVATPEGRDIVGSDYDWAISCGVIQSLSNEDARMLSSGMNRVANNVAHYMITEESGGKHRPHLNVKPLREWRSILGNDKIIDQGKNIVV
jgi:hypothetical protein